MNKSNNELFFLFISTVLGLPFISPNTPARFMASSKVPKTSIKPKSFDCKPVNTLPSANFINSDISDEKKIRDLLKKEKFDIFIPVKTPGIDSNGMALRSDGIGVLKLEKKIDSNYIQVDELVKELKK